MGTQRPVRLALIGLGDIGVTAHLPALEADPDAALVAVADTDAERVRTVAAGLDRDVATATDAEELLADPRLEAVVLATPPWVTARLAPKALAAGKWVLAEKPLAPTLEELSELRALDPELRARIQPGFTYRHHPAIERLRKLLQAGALGSPLLIRISGYDEQADPVGAPEHYRRVVETLEHGMPIVHEGAHFCDWLNFVLGASPVEVTGTAVRTDPSFAAPNLNSATVRYADGSVAMLETGWLTPVLPPGRHFDVTGPRGRVTIDPFTFDLEARVDGHREVLPAQDAVRTVCFARQLRRFLEAVREQRAPVPGLDDAIASMTFAEQIVAGTTTAAPTAAAGGRG